jgi:hypothetical protein
LGVAAVGSPTNFYSPPASFIYSFSGSLTMIFSNRLSTFFLAAALISVAGCASTSTKEGTGEYVDDTVITAKVKAALLNDATVKSREINVETFKGVVQLSGFVQEQADATKAAMLARGVKGVMSVKNDIRMK